MYVAFIESYQGREIEANTAAGALWSALWQAHGNKQGVRDHVDAMFKAIWNRVIAGDLEACMEFRGKTGIKVELEEA